MWNEFETNVKLSQFCNCFNKGGWKNSCPVRCALILFGGIIKGGLISESFSVCLKSPKKRCQITPHTEHLFIRSHGDGQPLPNGALYSAQICSLMQKTDTHLLLYIVANVYLFFCIRSYWFATFFRDLSWSENLSEINLKRPRLVGLPNTWGGGGGIHPFWET